jgi:hypothetical protein
MHSSTNERVIKAIIYIKNTPALCQIKIFGYLYGWNVHCYDDITRHKHLNNYLTPIFYGLQICNYFG